MCAGFINTRVLVLAVGWCIALLVGIPCSSRHPFWPFLLYAAAVGMSKWIDMLLLVVLLCRWSLSPASRGPSA